MHPDRPPTAFEEKVYDAVRMVPFGHVTTYKLLGKAIGCRSSQAIGQALKRHAGIPAPCHRIIKTDLSIGGFGGEKGGEETLRKLKLLKKEGVEFDKEGFLKEPDRLYEF